jgi:hypothetical protein
MGPDAGLNLQHLGYAGGKQSFFPSACLQQQQQQQEQQQQQQQQYDMAWTQHQDHWPQPPPPKTYFQQGMESLLYSPYSGVTDRQTDRQHVTQNRQFRLNRTTTSLFETAVLTAWRNLMAAKCYSM